MIDTPHISHSPRQLTAFIHFKIPREQIQQVMGSGIGELMATLAAQGLQPAGPLLSHHLKMDPDTFDFQICVPVASEVIETGRVKRGELRATRVARTVYHGGYEGLGNAWGEFMAWIAANDHAAADDLWECYVAGPETDADPLTWRTELIRPLND